jgi:hypothetical protein
MVVAGPCPALDLGRLGVCILYHLHRDNSDSLILAGSSVLSHGSLCPPNESCPNQNLFQYYFGIQYDHDGSSYVRGISTYEFAQWFGLLDQIQYCMSHKKHRFALDVSMPGCSLAWLFKQIHLHLINIRDANSEVFSPNQFAAPVATIQTLINGDICSCLPSCKQWVKAYKICNKSLSKVNHNYCMPLYGSHSF